MTSIANLSLHSIFWFVLIGWCAGWVTGRAIKGSGHGAWGDAVLGMVGGLFGGWLMRNTGHHGNWALLMSAMVAAVTASLLTWFFRSVIQHETWRLNHPRQKHA
jgi:uncharacterized membrane protein YeaQ/YmgE (transglycosylase-associated protein family)